MSAKSKVLHKSKDEVEVDKFNDSIVEYELLAREIEELKFDLNKFKCLLEEAVAQLGKTDDEYHSDLKDKILKELNVSDDT